MDDFLIQMGHQLLHKGINYIQDFKKWLELFTYSSLFMIILMFIINIHIFFFEEVLQTVIQSPFLQLNYHNSLYKVVIYL